LPPCNGNFQSAPPINASQDADAALSLLFRETQAFKMITCQKRLTVIYLLFDFLCRRPQQLHTIEPHNAPPAISHMSLDPTARAPCQGFRSGVEIGYQANKSEYYLDPVG
jgi:hypothetical protein